MTAQQILSAHKGARELYNNLIVTTIALAAKEPLKLFELNDIRTFRVELDGQKVTYAVALCRACIDHILMRINRRETMSAELRNELASLIVQTYDYFSVADLRCFEHMLLTGQLPTYINGQETAGFGAVDIPGFFAKLRTYDTKRPKGYDRANSRNSSTLKVEAEVQESTKPHIWETDPTFKRVDLQGVEHPEGWDYQSYWTGLPDPEEIEPIVQRIKSFRFRKV